MSVSANCKLVRDGSEVGPLGEVPLGQTVGVLIGSPPFELQGWAKYTGSLTTGSAFRAPRTLCHCRPPITDERQSLWATHDHRKLKSHGAI